MALAPFVIQQDLLPIAIAYRNRKAIADLVLPRMPVNSTSFKWTKFTQSDAFSIPDTRVGRKSRPNQIDWTAAEATDSTLDFALDYPIPMLDIQNAEAAQRIYGTAAVDPRMRATELISDLIMLDREKRVADLVFNANTYTSTYKTTLSGTSQWSDFTNSDPVNAILAACDIPLQRPNKMVIGRAVYTKLRQHPKVVAAVYAVGGNAASGGVVALRAMADLLELDEILVGEGWVNSAKKGQTASFARVWGKHCLLFYQDSNIQSPDGGVTFGGTAQFGSRIAGTIDNDPNIGMRGGTVVRVGEAVKELIMAPDVAYFFQNAIA